MELIGGLGIHFLEFGFLFRTNKGCLFLSVKETRVCVLYTKVENYSSQTK